jgi:hypothetical protein
MREKGLAMTFDRGKMLIRKPYSAQDSPAPDVPLQVGSGFFDLSMGSAGLQQTIGLIFDSSGGN